MNWSCRVALQTVGSLDGLWGEGATIGAWVIGGYVSWWANPQNNIKIRLIQRFLCKKTIFRSLQPLALMGDGTWLHKCQIMGLLVISTIIVQHRCNIRTPSTFTNDIKSKLYVCMPNFFWTI
jgi:hypothetical protein